MAGFLSIFSGDPASNWRHEQSQCWPYLLFHDTALGFRLSVRGRVLFASVWGPQPCRPAGMMPRGTVERFLKDPSQPKRCATSKSFTLIPSALLRLHRNSMQHCAALYILFVCIDASVIHEGMGKFLGSGSLSPPGKPNPLRWPPFGLELSELPELGGSILAVLLSPAREGGSIRAVVLSADSRSGKPGGRQ